MDGFRQRHIFGARVKPSGVLVDTSPLSLSLTSTGGEVEGCVASDGSNYLVLWTRNSNSGSGLDIEGRLVTEAGVLNPARITVGASGNPQDTPAVAALGDQYLVVWSDQRNYLSSLAADIYGTRVSNAGAILDPAGIPICVMVTNQTAPAIAANGAHYFVVWQDSRAGSTNSIFGTRITSSGTVLTPGGSRVCLRASDQRNPAVAAHGTEFLVVWENRTGSLLPDIFAGRIVGTGALRDPNGIIISAATNSQSAPTVAAGAGNYLIAWADVRHGGFLPDIWGARLTTNGHLLDPDGLPIALATNTQFNAAIAFNGSEYFVVWEDFRSGVNIMGSRVSVDGAVLDPNGFAIAATSLEERTPAIASFGSDYFVVWSSQRSLFSDIEFSDVFGARVGSDGSVGSTIVINTNATLRMSPVVARGMASDFLVASRGHCEGALRLVGNIVNLASAPLADAQVVALHEDSSLAITLTGSDPDGGPLTLAVSAGPARGILSGTPPNLVYTPGTNFFGPDSFTFTVSDVDGESAVAVVQITVAPVNDPPIAVARIIDPNQSGTPILDHVIVAVDGEAAVVLDGSASFDVENDPLQYRWFLPGSSEPFAADVRVTNTFGIGSHVVILEVSDGISSARAAAQFEVVGASGPTAILILWLDETPLDRGRKRPLMASLKAALGSFEAGNFKAGANQLQALQNKIDAQIAPGDPGLAAELKGVIRQIVASIENAEHN